MSVPEDQEPNDVLSYLKGIFDQLILLNNNFEKVYGAAKQAFNVEILEVGTSASALYRDEKVVRSGFIMNLSKTDNVTIRGSGSASGKIQDITAGQGIILNRANATGQGGGVFNFGNIDLSTITIVTNLNDTQQVAVVYYN